MSGPARPTPSDEGMPSGESMPVGRLERSGRPSRGALVRGAAVVVITATITLAAACSDEDTVDTIPPPWPVRTTEPDGPAGPPKQTATSTVTVVPTHPTTTRRP